jgi:hypothetical protein
MIEDRESAGLGVTAGAVQLIALPGPDGGWSVVSVHGAALYGTTAISSRR